jgi:VanZ family protein
MSLERRYGLLTVAYLAAIYWLSSLPDLSSPAQDPVVLLLMNVGHAPLFAGLAFCVWKTFSTVGDVWWARYALAFGICGACGALDEWHQSFVPGRMASLGDLLVDLAGIAGILLILRVHALQKERHRVLSGAPVSAFPMTGHAAHAAGTSARK